MNKKTFSLAVIFLCVAVALLLADFLWFYEKCTAYDWIIAAFLVIAGIWMVWNELHKKKRPHLTEVDKNKIP